MFRRLAVLALFVLALPPQPAQAGPQERSVVVIGTGGVTGVYYPAGAGICQFINRHREEHGIRCAVEATDGSVENVRGLRDGEFDLGIVQSDVQAMASDGTGRFRDDGAYPGLRAVFSLHTEPLHVMVRADSAIHSVADFKGRRVNIGSQGSGSRLLAELLLKGAGVSASDFALTAELKSSEQSRALCDRSIDVTIWAAGVLNVSSMNATSACDVRLLDLGTAGTYPTLAANRTYAPVKIPGGTYPGNPMDIHTWGPKATLVSDAAVPEAVVYEVVKAVFEDLAGFRKLHPAFASLRPQAMIRDGISVPLHDGASRYYREHGLN